ncbi:MAG: PAS domain S-box protein [Leptospirales bacterium]|nr:PAS domain S-box protein [Leptospirales bacterium]
MRPTSRMRGLPEERYRSLFERAPLGFLVTDRNGNVTAINAMLKSLLAPGRTASKLNVLTNQRLKKAGIAEHFRYCMNRAEPVISECDLKTSGSYSVFIQYYLTPFRDDKRRIAGVQAVVINATAQKEAQREFLNIYNYTNRLVASLSPLLTLDARGKIQFVNDSLLSTFKLRREQALGKDPATLLKLSPLEKRLLRENIKKSSAEDVSGREFKSGNRIFGYSIFRFGESCGIILRELTETRRLERKVARLHSQLIHTQESERQKIASELHDGVGQTILAAKINLVAFQKDPAQFDDRFEAGLDLIDRASQDLRDIYTNLYPSTLRDLGLASTIRWYARNVLEVRGMRVKLGLDTHLQFNSETEINLFRIVQEVFANILKHSRATRVSLELGHGEKSITLSIKDNGAGFSPGQAQESRGFGLENIRRRSEDLGGSVKIESKPGKGSHFRIELPAKPQDTARK